MLPHPGDRFLDVVTVQRSDLANEGGVGLVRRDEVERPRRQSDSRLLDHHALELDIVASQLFAYIAERFYGYTTPPVLAEKRVDGIVADTIVRPDVDEEEIGAMQSLQHKWQLPAVEWQPPAVNVEVTENPTPGGS